MDPARATGFGRGARGVGAALVVSLAALSGTLGGCGSDEPTFGAQEFVAAANENGAGLALGGELDTGSSGEVFALAFDDDHEETGATGPSGSRSEPHSGASLKVTDDPDAGFAEYTRCEAAATLLCFRASNIVLIFEGSVPPADLARLARAIQAIGSG